MPTCRDTKAFSEDLADMLELGVKILIAYCLGSVMGAMLIGMLRGNVDIRTMGSGNAGATNALRTQGSLFALGVVLIDIGKGVVGAGVVPHLALPLSSNGAVVSRDLLVYGCAAATVAGHVWPLWHRFQGGKGAATLIGTLAALAPVLLIPVLSVWILLIGAFGYVGLATIVAGFTAPLLVAATQLPEARSLLYYAIFCAVFLLYTHRSNVQRMREGNELQNTKLMFLRGKRVR